MASAAAPSSVRARRAAEGAGSAARRAGEEEQGLAGAKSIAGLRPSIGGDDDAP